VVAQERVAQDVYLLTVAAKGGGAPGQFYLLRAWDRDPLLSRPLSIYTATDATVSFLYQVRGRGTALLSRCKASDCVTLLGPLGHGFRRADLRGRVAIVTGGIGIAPMRALAEQLPPQHTTLIAGFRSAPFALRDFEQLGVHIRVATEDGCAGSRGLCTDLLDPSEFDSVATCGPAPMMARVAVMCAEAHVPCQVSLEARMACGVGACLVCACATLQGNRRVCSDGPVFDATEVVWHA
jgi:dihydroorotate dehydrogenase electron transfer subunit